MNLLKSVVVVSMLLGSVQAFAHHESAACKKFHKDCAKGDKACHEQVAVDHPECAKGAHHHKGDMKKPADTAPAAPEAGSH